MESFSAAISEPPETPRSNTQSRLALGLGRTRSRATRRRTYSANETPISLARWCACLCSSFSSVICVRDIMMAPSYHHQECLAEHPLGNLRETDTSSPRRRDLLV